MVTEWESISTWRQPKPAPASAEHADVIIDNRDFRVPLVLQHRRIAEHR